MGRDVILLMLEAMIMYFLVLAAHSLRHRFGPVHFYALIGGITAVMSWVTDAGLVVQTNDITFVVGSTVFYTSLLLGVFVVYVFDGPKATRITISTVVGVSMMMPLIAAALHLQARLIGESTMINVPWPSLRINTASVVATLLDLVFLGIAWEFLGKPALHMKLVFRTFLTLLGVMWLDVVLFATGAFAGTPGYFSIMQGTLVSRLIISLFALPFLYGYLHWQSSREGVQIENRPVLAILRQVAEIEHELTAAQQEIERRKQAEAALRRSEERFRTIVDVLPQFVAYVDKELKYRFVNRTFKEQLGIDPDNLVGTPLPEVIGQDAFGQARPHVERALSGEQVRYYERYDFAVGGTRDIDGVLIPDIDGRRGQVLGYYAVLTDITPYMRTQATLEKSEERYRRLVESSPDIMYIHSDQQGMTFWSSRVTEILGYSPQELCDTPDLWRKAIHPDDLALVNRTIVGGEDHADGEIEYRVQDKEGGWHWFRDRLISRHRARNETVTERLATDITERREMAEQLRQQERLAAVGQLAGGIAHDFNNLLAAIVLYAQIPLNRHSDLPSDVVKSLATILSESERAANLVQQILDFSRKAMLKTEALDLVPFTERVMSILRRTIPENIRLKLNLKPEQCVVQADPTRIQQALMNLAVNARDAMPAGGELRIELHTAGTDDMANPPAQAPETGPWACLRVRDTGMGMTEEVKAHLFEPFFTTKPPGEGTGLGLSQVYGIVKQHKGQIEVESSVGKGTSFSIYLPIETGGAEDVARDTATEIAAGHGESLLLVEDSPELRRAIADYLSSLGYRVFTAETGEEALRFAAGIAPDLLITDVVMPHLGGEALLQRMRQIHPDIKALAVTGHVLDTDVESLMNAGFSDCLTKPFDVTELSNVIHRLLNPS